MAFDELCSVKMKALPSVWQQLLKNSVKSMLQSKCLPDTLGENLTICRNFCINLKDFRDSSLISLTMSLIPDIT